MNVIDQFLFGIYPYIAGAVFLVGSLIRYDRDQYSWKAHSSQLLSNKDMRLGSNLFHIGILMLFVGHFVGLLTPASVFHFFGISAGAKQLLAVVAGGVFGSICFIGMTLLVRRRLFDPRIRATSSRNDLFILLLLYVQLILGLITIPLSLTHLDGGAMLKLMAWAQHVVYFQGDAAAQLEGIGFVFKLHLFLGVSLFLVFPFTRLVHVWSIPLGYLTRNPQLVRKH